MAVTANLLPNGRQSFTTNTGIPLVGGMLYTYAAGTDTPAPTWKDSAKVAANTNPVILNARGEASIFWDGVYKIVLRDALGFLIWTQDNVFASQPASVADLAAPTGASLIGYKGRTLQQKLGEILSVMDFGAKADGTTDDYPAFVAALNAAGTGDTIYVPVGNYYLSANPDPVSFSVIAGIGHNTRSKYVSWDIDVGAIFSGPGVGLPDANLKFLSPITNPYIQTIGRNVQYDLRQQVTLNGGALIGDTKELAEDFGYAVSVTGNLTNGQATITNASGAFAGVIKRGDRIEGTATGWPTGPFYRVWDVSGNTITFGIDAGAGPAGPTNWTGATTTGASFTIYKKQWMAIEYRGMTTGGPNSRDMAYGIRNDVINLTGGPANSYEIDIISLANTGTFNRGIFLTGHGDADNTITAIDIQRAGKTPWGAALAVRGAVTGFFQNSKNPLSIDAVYLNGATGLPEPINFGMHLNNAPAIRGAVVEAGQIADGSQAIVIWRYTDVNPAISGRFLQFMNQANTSELMFVDIFGAIQTYAPATSGGSTTNSGGVMTNGLTLRGGTNLQLGQTRAAGTPTANGTVTVYGSDGQPIKLMTAA